LFWQLGLAVERTATALLGWSRWRRWHQAWARYYHYRRRSSSASPRQQSPPAADAVEVLEVVWGRLAALLPSDRRTGRPYAHDRRVVLEAIMYVMHSGGGWRDLPAQFPPWQTVYAQLCRWKESGIWDKIWEGVPQSHQAS
jgi:putative transposase